MKLVIIESPYSGDVETNETFARACMLDSLTRGEAPFLSHLLYTQVLNDTEPDQREQGIAAGHAWCRAADALVVYTDMGVSRGMQERIELANDLGLKIEFRSLAETKRECA